MTGGGMRFPAVPEIADFSFQAFDLKPQRPAGRKYHFHNPGRGRRFTEGDVEYIEDLAAIPVAKTPAGNL